MMNLHRAIALQVSSLIDECFPRARHRIRAYYMHGSLSTRNGGSPKEGRFHDWRSPNKAKQATKACVRGVYNGMIGVGAGDAFTA